MLEALEEALRAHGVRFSARRGAVDVLDGEGAVTATIQLDRYGLTASIGAWHDHVPRDEDGIDWLAGLLGCWVRGRARIVTLWRIGLPAVWRIEAQTLGGEWQGVSETGLLIPPLLERRGRLTYCEAPYGEPSAAGE